MWPDSEGLGQNGVVVVDEHALASQAPAAVSQLNVTNSSRVHVGPKFVSVTQNIQNSEVIKGRFLGLEIVSPKQARRLRCSVAVFVCWALVVASGLAFYLFHFIAHMQITRLDIELGFPRYLWSVIKNTTRAERLSCAVAVLLILICAVLITYFTITSKTPTDSDDIAPHEWKITRKMWLAEDYNDTDSTEEYEPLRLVIVQHSVSSPCRDFIICAAELRNMQKSFIKDKDCDIPYNFMIGNDGRVYEGRGWHIVGAHTKGFNLCSLGIGFIGDYREEIEGYTKVTKAQLNRTQMLLDEGVRAGFLHPSYVVVGAKDLQASESPGSNLYAAIKKWTHYDHENRYKGKNCTQIIASPITMNEKALE